MTTFQVDDKVRVRDNFSPHPDAHSQLKQHVAEHAIGTVIAHAGGIMNAIGAYGVLVNFSGVEGNDWYFDIDDLTKQEDAE